MAKKITQSDIFEGNILKPMIDQCKMIIKESKKIERSMKKLVKLSKQ